MTMIPTVTPCSAAAAGSRSRGMSRGVMADFVAMTIEFAAEFTTLRTKSHPTVSRPVHASTASSAVEPKVTTAASKATVRRSNASASMPP